MSRFPFWSDEPFELTDEEWYSLRPDERTQWNHALRRWRLAAARETGSHTDEEWDWLLEACGDQCVRCGATETIQKDHIIPLRWGGGDTIVNLQPLCRSCNASKGSAWIADCRPDHVRKALELDDDFDLAPDDEYD